MKKLASILIIFTLVLTSMSVFAGPLCCQRTNVITEQTKARLGTDFCRTSGCLVSTYKYKTRSYCTNCNAEHSSSERTVKEHSKSSCPYR
ncbi:hypothetical protein CLPU_2c01640 [Gottschalkia purinilytica]|uniref:Uncharacterized protein n=1 Tax=Gottschalkia purinilytica TaxID=1503 RepID=A0A0L0WE07_GOTPU|nr:hypothetical protein [Gottschalkia purinilytica]KNF09712.1 hypothetical protein CLPU_2c01640 [Gottschalkia purinilytica]